MLAHHPSFCCPLDCANHCPSSMIPRASMLRDACGIAIIRLLVCTTPVLHLVYSHLARMAFCLHLIRVLGPLGVVSNDTGRHFTHPTHLNPTQLCVPLPFSLLRGLIGQQTDRQNRLTDTHPHAHAHLYTTATPHFSCCHPSPPSPPTENCLCAHPRRAGASVGPRLPPCMYPPAL